MINTCHDARCAHKSAPMVMRGDIHPTARWVPSTPHRSRPAGHPPNRQSGAAGAQEREYNEGCDFETGLPRHCNPQLTTQTRAMSRRKPTLLPPDRCAGQLRQPAHRAASEGRTSRPPSRLRRVHATRLAPTTTSCAGSRISCRKRTAPPPSRCSKDVTAHPHRPGGRPGLP